jgi:hypothetical protein
MAGSSRCMALRRPATASGVAAWPSRICAVSPGSMLVAKNTAKDTMSSVIRAMSSRFITR